MIQLNKLKNISKLKGSGILVVILSAIAFSIYSTSVFSESKHFSLIFSKYEKSISNYYEKNVNDVDGFYDYILKLNK